MLARTEKTSLLAQFWEAFLAPFEVAAALNYDAPWKAEPTEQ